MLVKHLSILGEQLDQETAIDSTIVFQERKEILSLSWFLLINHFCFTLVLLFFY